MTEGARLVAELAAATTHHLRAGDGRVSVHRSGPELLRCLESFEAGTTDLVMNMQRHYSVATHRVSRPLDDRSRERGIRERTVVDRRTAAGTPLLSSVEPAVRVGPVPVPAMVSDRRRALVPIPEGLGTDGGCCSTEVPELVGLAVTVFQWVWDRSRSWQDEGLRDPLPPRRFEVALMLTDGLSDREIAHELGVSARTVSEEVRAVVDWLGARNRPHAVAMLVGAA